MAADKPFPWTTLASKTVVDNKWVRVEEHDVLNVKGTPGHYTTLHFKRVATGAVALDKGGFVFLVGQHRYPLRAYSWEVPEGGTDPGEAPLAAIQRELKEEAGVSAGAWRHILTMHLSNMMSDEIAFGYLATDLTLGTAEPEESEVLTPSRWRCSSVWKSCGRGANSRKSSGLEAFTLRTAPFPRGIVNYVKETGLGRLPGCGNLPASRRGAAP